MKLLEMKLTLTLLTEIYNYYSKRGERGERDGHVGDLMGFFIVYLVFGEWGFS